MKSQLHVETPDGFRLTVHKFEPSKDNEKVILISCGIGIRQYFYANYAIYLASLGYTVYTYDYRGIGESGVDDLRHFDATILDWAKRDLQSVTDHILIENKDKPIYFIGHSIGGAFIGLSKASLSFDRIVTVASQYGYWKHYQKKYQLIVLLFSLFTIPFFNLIYGYFPSNTKRRGAPIPKGVAQNWATLGLDSRSLLALADGAKTYYDQINCPALLLSMEDDIIAPKGTVDRYAFEALINAQVERRHILLSENEGNPIGHSNFFKRSHKRLWDIPIAWLAS